MKITFRDKSLRKTERIKSRAKLEASPSSEIDYRALLEGSLDMVCLVEIVNGIPRFLYVSPSALEVVGWEARELIDSSPQLFCTSESMAIIAADVKKLAGGHQFSTVLIEGVRKGGTQVWLENKVRVLRVNEDGGMTVMVCMRDVTRRKLLEDQLARMALADGLTGIDNRRAFDQAFDREWKSSARTGSALSLVLMDVDRFKLFNDRYGHQVGDDCLRAIARVARSTARRPGDVAARYGGEEFVLLLPNTDVAHATTLADRLRRNVHSLQISHEGNAEAGGVVTVSCGVSTLPPRQAGHVHAQGDLLTAADNALYRAKSHGRNQVATAPSIEALETALCSK